MTDSNPPMMNEAGIEDPEAYNRQQRFKEIHEARQRVVRALAEDDALHECDGFRIPGSSMNRISTLVALYIMELRPLLRQLEDGLEYGMERFDHEDWGTNSLEHFALCWGNTHSKEGRGTKPAHIAESMRAFQVANQAYAELGMELELSAGNDDASFDYSDLLEDDQPSPPEIPQQNDD